MLFLHIPVWAFASTTKYASDLPYTQVANGWGPIEKDKSNGEDAAGDGGTLTLNGVTYAKGLGAHAASDIRFNLDGACTAFTAVVGIDDEVGNWGSAVFQVWVDSVKQYDSGVRTGSQAGTSVNVNVSGGNEMHLVMTDGGDGNGGDHGDWANAQVTCNRTYPTYLSDLTWTYMTNSWGTAEKDQSNGESATGDGHPLTLNGVQYAKGLGVHADSEIRYALDGTCSAFTAVIGIDDEVASGAGVKFQVWVDSALKYQSAAMNAASPGKRIGVDLTAATELKLIVTSEGDLSGDHADWADARLTCGNASVVVATTDDLEYLVTTSAPGATFFLKSGVHRIATGLAALGAQTFVGETDAIISGAKVLPNFVGTGGWTYDSSNSRWWIDGQTQEGNQAYSVGYSPNNQICMPSPDPHCAFPEDLWFGTTVKKHQRTLANLSAGEWHFDYVANRIYVKDNPSGQTIETSVAEDAFHGSGARMTVANLILERFASPPQHAIIHANAATGWMVLNNEVRYGHARGVNIHTGMTLIGNAIHHNLQIGIGNGGTGALVLSNEIAYNNYTGMYSVGWEAGGTKFVSTSNLVVRRNNVHHNEGPGLWTDIDNKDCTYENNTVDDNTWMGIFHEIGYACIIRNNVVRRNGFSVNGGPGAWVWSAGILIAASRDVQVYGNYVYDNADGIGAVQQDRSMSGSQPYGLYRVVNLNVHDNYVAGTVGSVGVNRDAFTDSIYTSDNNHFENNHYYFGSGTGNWWYWIGNNTYSFSTWQTTYGNDDTGSFGTYASRPTPP